MSRQPIWILAFLLSISIASAYSIDVVYPINSTSYNFSVVVGVPQNFSIKINNTGNEKIYNISASEMYPYEFFQIDSLEPSQTADLNFQVKSNEVFGFSPFYPTVYFSFPDTSSAEPKTVSIIMNTSSFLFNPRNITINENDTICWDNRDNSSHWVKEIGASPRFSSNISKNQQFCFKFTQAFGHIEYYDEVTGKNGHIVVESLLKSILSHDPLLDKPASIALKSEYPLAQVLVENYISNFTISYNGVAEGVFRVLNVYNETIRFMNFEMSKPIASETSFSDSGFDLKVNESKIINFRIKPTITLTSETEKNYSFNLIIKGDNIVPQSYPLSVYVIKRDFEMNESECFDWFAFCQQYPTSTTCTGYKPTIKIENQTIYMDKEWQYNLSERELRDLIHREAEGISAFGRIENKLDDTDNRTAELIGVCNRAFTLANQSNEKCNNYRERYDKRIHIEWILFITFMIIGIIGGASFGGWKMYRKWDKKVRSEGSIRTDWGGSR